MRSFIFILVLAVSALLLAGCTQNGNSGTPSSSDVFQGLGNPASASDGTVLPLYSLADVAQHNQLSDCWMAINGSVYNFTGSMMMSRNASLSALCGTDATSSFSSMMARGNFTRNGTYGGFGGRMNGGSGQGGYGGGSGSGSGSFNRTRAGAGGFSRMMIGKLG